MLYIYEVCSINTQTKIITEKYFMLSIMLLHQNKLEIMTIISVYNNNHYLKSVIDSARSKLVILYKIAISRWIIFRSNTCVLNFVSKLGKMRRKLLK
jgi:hypothetical protein